MPTALEAKIAQVAATKLCRFCQKPVPPDAVICACRIERGEIPHTEWPRELKRWLCVRAIERRRLSHMSEQDLWTGLATAEYLGRWVGDGRDRKIVNTTSTIVDVFPYAAGDAALWAKSGFSTSFHI